jgi:hypothetical protein
MKVFGKNDQYYANTALLKQTQAMLLFSLNSDRQKRKTAKINKSSQRTLD